MNAQSTTFQTRPTQPQSERHVVIPFVAGNRLGARERDFGVGYGKSSGYATRRSYTTQWAQPRFRFG